MKGKCLSYSGIRIALLWITSGVLLVIGGKLLAVHIWAIDDVRASALPLAQEIPVLERRVKVLSEQRELSELSDALRIGSPEERVHVYALPKETDFTKVVTALDLFMESLERRKILKNRSSLQFGEAHDVVEGIRAQDITFTASVHREGVLAIETFTRVSGLLSVADAFSPEERESLLRETELENPAAIVALEQYFQTDLGSFLREPRPAQEKLLRSFSTQAFEHTFRDVLRGSIIPDAERLFSGAFLQTLVDRKLWPMQMLSIGKVSLTPGRAADWYTVECVLRAYTRS